MPVPACFFRKKRLRADDTLVLRAIFALKLEGDMRHVKTIAYHCVDLLQDMRRFAYSRIFDLDVCR